MQLAGVLSLIVTLNLATFPVWLTAATGMVSACDGPTNPAPIWLIFFCTINAVTWRQLRHGGNWSWINPCTSVFLYPTNGIGATSHSRKIPSISYWMVKTGQAQTWTYHPPWLYNFFSLAFSLLERLIITDPEPVWRASVLMLFRTGEEWWGILGQTMLWKWLYLYAHYLHGTKTPLRI